MSVALPSIGELLAGKYRIDHQLGEGGFATVLAATDVTSGQIVAVKVLKLDGDSYSHQTRARFRREVDALAGLRSPYIVQVIDDGETDDGQLYAVFEHVPGRDLSRVLGEMGQLSPQVAEHILRQLLHALHEAHRAGVLHRDLKPENIRVFNENGDPWRVKLLDFGIARPVDDGSPSLTATGELIGTPRYMSPEQLTEKPLTAASDIYSLGVVAWELCAGREALHGGSWKDQLPRLELGHQLVPDQSATEQHRLYEVVRQMTMREPAQRLRSAAATLHALDGAAQKSAAATEGRGVWLIPVVIVVLVVVLALRGDDDVPAPQNTVGPATTPDINGLLKTTEAAAPADAAIPKSDAGSERCGVDLAPGEIRLGEDVFYVPPTYDATRPVPLVVLFHEANQRPAGILDETEFRPLADKHGFLVLAPQGQIEVVAGKHMKPSSAPWDPPLEGILSMVPDAARLRAHLEEPPTERVADVIRGLIARHCIDTNRIFAVGHVHGADGAHRIAHDTDIFRGVAITSHRYSAGKAGEPRALLPTLLINPMEIPAELPDGTRGRDCGESEELFSIAATEERYVGRHRCTGPRQTSALHGDCSTWTDCAVPLTACRVDGGRHWPALPADAYTDITEQDRRCAGKPGTFPYGEVIWQFFASLEADEPADEDAGR